MATQFSEIGKNAALKEVFKDCGFTNTPAIRTFTSGAVINRIFFEGVDFDLTYTPLKHLGYKLMLNVVGELYAALDEPAAADFKIAVSNRFGVEDVKEFWTGVTAAAKEHGISKLSLDLLPSPKGLVVSIAGVGTDAKGLPEEKSKPVSTDLILLSGNVGAAYMGLHILEREKAVFVNTSNAAKGKQPDLTDYKFVIGEYLSPYIKPGVMQRFAEAGIRPTAGCFVNRGLGATAKQLEEATGLGVKLYIDKIPISSKAFEVAKELNLDPITAAINGGDDYKLVFTAPISCHEILRRDFQDWDVIGHLARPEVGTVLVTPEGAEINIRAQEYDAGV